MIESEHQETWKTLIDTFYDFETLEVRSGCDEFFEDTLSMKIAICARLAQTGHKEDALRLWNHIVATQNSSHLKDPGRLDYRPISKADVEISPVAFPPVAAKGIKRNQISSQDARQCTLEHPANGAKAEEEESRTI